MIYCSSNDFQMYQLTAMIQKATSILVLIQNIKLASKWPKLMKQWCQSDLIMNRRYGYLKNFNRKMKICLALYFLVYTVHFFLSNFNDMFIISLSMALALRFKQIRNRLEYNERNNHKIGMSDFWLEMRRDYDRLFHICKNLDDCINGLILISFSYNMYFVISYLYHQLMIENNRGQIVMFYCFFPYLALRVFAVCLYTSWINDESLGPVNILNSIQSRDYNPEIGRWLVQMSFDDVTLTGGKIFKIKRSIFLS
ncbi:Trehalose recp domain containing protein, partial [Asbolus verrucosus]